MAAPTNSFGHPDCYARALGGCCRKMTDEHYISEGVLKLVYGRAGEISRSVLVRGLAFQKQPGALQKIGVARLESKILCNTHNSLLRHFDGVEKAMFAGTDGLNDAAGRIELPEKVVRID